MSAFMAAETPLMVNLNLPKWKVGSVLEIHPLLQGKDPEKCHPHCQLQQGRPRVYALVQWDTLVSADHTLSDDAHVLEICSFHI